MFNTYMIWGGSGWIGGMLANMLSASGNKVVLAKSRQEDMAAIETELDSVMPDFVLNAAGITGRPNVDGCESQKQKTILVNVCGVINLANACWKRGIHMTNYSSGCLYEPGPILADGSECEYTEEDPPNFFGSTYSVTKYHAQELLKYFPNVLTLRLRMPISEDLSPRNFITKIINYKKVVNIPNSMTILGELLPISIDMTNKKLSGIYNLTNPGSISHNEVLALYQKYVNPDFKWENFTVEEQSKILVAGRSNCTLSASKLLSLYPTIQPIHVAMEDVMKTIASNKA